MLIFTILEKNINILFCVITKLFEKPSCIFDITIILIPEALAMLVDITLRVRVRAGADAEMCLRVGGGEARRPRPRPRKSAGGLEGAVSPPGGGGGILGFRYSGRLGVVVVGEGVLLFKFSISHSIENTCKKYFCENICRAPSGSAPGKKESSMGVVRRRKKW